MTKRTLNIVVHNGEGKVFAKGTSEIEMSGNEFRVKIYRDNGNFLGYKADSFWALRERMFKVHHGSIDNFERAPLANLLFLLNKGFDEEKKKLARESFPEKFKVVLESIDGEKKITSYDIYLNGENFEYKKE